MVDYSAPKPVDPIWYQPHGVLRINCRCGRRVEVGLADFAHDNRLPRDMKLYAMIARLRCRVCRDRPGFAEVVRARR